VSAVGVRSAGPFPDLALPDLGGRAHALAEAWREGGGLILIGHQECRTTRQAIPYAERIHRQRTRGAVVLVLQDDVQAAGRLAAELGLDLPIRVEPDPYPLARALELGVVPAFLLVDASGRIERASVGLRRAELEAFAKRLGVEEPFFTPQDEAPEFRPG
jgi:hypothetical protein